MVGGPERPLAAKPDLYVVARFLDRLVRDARPRTKTQLQLAVRLNYDQFLRYLEHLEGRGLARRIPGPNRAEVIEVTPAGREAHARLMAVLRQWVDEGRL